MPTSNLPPRMESPLQEAKRCPGCPSGLIAPTDPHLCCYECLGREHAVAGLERRPDCISCRCLPRLRRQQRADFFADLLLSLSPDASVEEHGSGEESISGQVAAPTSPPPLDEAPLVPSGFCSPSPPQRVEVGDDMETLSISEATDSGAASLNADFPLVMAVAAECAGLSLPPPLPPKPVSRLRQGFYGPAQPTRPAFIAPALSDIWHAVRTPWVEPHRAKATIAGMIPFLRVENETETSFPGVPPLEEALAALIIPQSAGWSASRKPLPPSPQDRDTLEVLDKIAQLSAQLAAAANNLGVLGVAAATFVSRDAPPSSDLANHLGRTIGQMNNLTSAVATAAGRITALATTGSRQVWLGLTALPKRDREDLLAAPLSKEGLFGSLPAVTQRLKRLEEDKAQLSKHLSLAAPVPHKRDASLPRRSSTARRRERRRLGNPVSSTKAADDTPAPPAPAQRPRDGSSARAAGRGGQRPRTKPAPAARRQDK